MLFLWIEDCEVGTKSTYASTAWPANLAILKLRPTVFTKKDHESREKQFGLDHFGSRYPCRNRGLRAFASAPTRHPARRRLAAGPRSQQAIAARRRSGYCH